MISFFLGLFVCSMLFAAANDIMTMTIPNWVSAALCLLFFPMIVVSQISMVDLGWHLLSATLALGICIILFCFGLFGGGDAKLLPAAILWAGPSGLITFLLGMTLFGGILAIIFVATKRWRKNLVIGSVPVKSLSEEGGIPYAVAISAGTFYALPNFEVFSTIMN